MPKVAFTILLEISICKDTLFISHTQDNQQKYCPQNGSIVSKSSHPIIVCRTIGCRCIYNMAKLTDILAYKQW